MIELRFLGALFQDLSQGTQPAPDLDQFIHEFQAGLRVGQQGTQAGFQGFGIARPIDPAGRLRQQELHGAGKQIVERLLPGIVLLRHDSLLRFCAAIQKGFPTHPTLLLPRSATPKILPTSYDCRALSFPRGTDAAPGLRTGMEIRLMYRTFLLLTLSLCLLAGCGRSKPAVDPRQVVDLDKRDDKPDVKDPIIPVKPVDLVDDHSAVATLVARVTRPSDQERFDAALLDALGFLADKKYNQALLSLETARSIQDTEMVRQQIGKVKALMDQQIAAEKSVQDIQTVLDQGKPEDAAKLSTAALQQFGGTDAAPALSQLKQEADAVTVAPGSDKDAQRGPVAPRRSGRRRQRQSPGRRHRLRTGFGDRRRSDHPEAV